MTNDIDFVKQQIMEQFKIQKSDSGEALNVRGFMLNVVPRWNPKQQDLLERAVEELASSGLIEDREGTPFLTQQGVDYLYPDIGDSIKVAILDFFAKANARAGHAFNTRSFMHTEVLNWNPKQKHGLEPAMKSLIEEGLIEENERGYFLTEAGFNSIY
ncbi:hypothetical protein [uncultured Pseudoalteromonas sp.]|uniref:hypothetical protein n=1 Tax=Pseudoalteromonas sp. DY56-GL22 TaxID=2967126 RepID=UPI002606C890|nr:hypothetical protein [uncultured Pseudoalteromonas sp.]MED5514333.1 hypothetical protein [Pseudomonadota bacterium]